MSENGLLPEEWGGETPMVAVSVFDRQDPWKHVSNMSSTRCDISSIMGVEAKTM